MKSSLLDIIVLGTLFKSAFVSEAIQCGQPVIQPVSTRIIGGQEARPGSWPWMVMLAELGIQVCGGTILNEKFILTAAHCFEDELSKNRTRWEAYVGKHHVTIKDTTESIHHITKIILHPGYDNTTLMNDIALLELFEPIQYNDHVLPACVPPTKRRVAAVGDMCYSTGWGYTKGTGDRTVLNQVGLPIISSYFCARGDWYGSRYIHRITFCAGYEGGGKDACSGDSGGPYNCHKDGKWYVQGITSWGYECAQPRWPGIYTDVSKYGSWIRETMLNQGFPLIEE